MPTVLIILALLLSPIPASDTLTATWSDDRGTVTIRWQTDGSGDPPCLAVWRAEAWRVLEGTCQHTGEGWLINNGTLIGMRYALIDPVTQIVRATVTIPAPYHMHLPMLAVP